MDQNMHGGETRCLIGLGGNTGPVHETFNTALEMLNSAGCSVESRSECHLTLPMGSVAGGTFTNAAACLITDLSPLRLLDLLQAVELACGRARSVRWGPRRLDLDLLFYGKQTIHSDRLTVPHPGLWYRRFVLEPLAEIAPEWKHPGSVYTIDELRQRLYQRPLIIEVDGVDTLPPLPDRYTDGVADVRSAGIGQSVQQPFCRLRVDTDDQRHQTTGESASEDFQLSVPQEELEGLIHAILSAALGI